MIGYSRRATTKGRVTVERSRFDTVATQYAAGRPDYPAALFDRLAELIGRPLDGADVVDLGAGTGIASRQMAARGAHVLAVELSAAMAAQLAATSPGVRVVLGSGSALPVRGGAADLVTCAQAWHWMDPARAVPQIRRVLRPGGVFAAWWNFTTRERAWELLQEERISAVSPHWREAPNGRAKETLDTLPGLTDLREHRFSWWRAIPMDRYLMSLASKSYIAALDDTDGFLAREREILAKVFPGGTVREDFVTKLVTAVEPRA
jgi:SAM-dependent methyltransferase